MKAAKRAILDVVGGTVVSALGYLAVLGGCIALTAQGIELPLFGDRGIILWGLFTGIPIGAAAGLWLVERFVYRVRPPIAKAFVVGFIPSVVAVVLAIPLLDRLGTEALLAFPPLVTLCFAVALWLVARRTAAS